MFETLFPQAIGQYERLGQAGSADFADSVKTDCVLEKHILEVRNSGGTTSLKLTLLRCFYHDWLRLCIVFTASFMIALGFNALGLSTLEYLSRQDRLDRQVAKLGSSLVASVPAGTDVSLSEMQSISARHDTLILDARPQIFYSISHIPSALSLPRDDFENRYRALGKNLDPYRGSMIVVYCSERDCQDAQMVTDALRKLGYSQVRVFERAGRDGSERGFQAERTGMKLTISFGFWLVLLLRLFLGGLFIYSGLSKIISSKDFADTLASYRILPDAVINLTASGLPFFELACGTLVITGFLVRVGVLGILSMMLTFTAALLSVMMRGVSIDCGCFGPHSWLDTSPTFSLLRDVVLFLVAFFLYWHYLLLAFRRRAARRNSSRHDVKNLAQ